MKRVMPKLLELKEFRCLTICEATIKGNGTATQTIQTYTINPQKPPFDP